MPSSRPPRSSRWQRLARVAVAAAAVAIAPLTGGAVDASPAPTVTADRGPRAPGGGTARVAVVGDSLTVGVAGELDRLLGGYSLALDARVSRSTGEAPAALDRTRAPGADVVIIALGTNDASNASRYPALTATALAHVNPLAHLIWVLPHRFTPAIDQVRGAVQAALAVRPHSATVDDDALWANPAFRAGDHIHFTAAGYSARARLLAGAVDRALQSVSGFAARAGGGSWTSDARGRVTGLGGAPTFGDASSLPLNRPIVGMASSRSGQGYWLVAADGGIFGFGDAAFFGSTGGARLNAPVVAVAATAGGQGYWLLALDGGIFSFGDAAFHGSTGGQAIPAPAVAMAATDRGYLLAGLDGSVYAFGDARQLGSTRGVRLNAPVVGIARVPQRDSYWMVGADGGVFAFGPDAAFLGSTAALTPPPQVVGLAARADRRGYTVVGGDGHLYDFP